MPGPKLNEHPVLRRRPNSRAVAVEATPVSSRAIARFIRVSPYKVRQVLDLVRGHDVRRAQDLLMLCDRDAATLVGKVLDSATANAETNHGVEAEDLFVSACFADEGPTLKRWRPRARGRATKIRKRTSHITVIVSRYPEDELRRRRAERAQETTGRRVRRQRSSTATPKATPTATPTDEADSAPVTAVDETTSTEPDTTETAGATDTAEASDSAVDEVVAEAQVDATDEATAEADDTAEDSPEPSAADGEAPAATKEQE